MSMAAMMGKAKAMTISAGDAAARNAKATKLKGEIVMLQRNVTSVKKEFGVLVFDQMVQANRPEVERLFGETRAKIDALEQQIAAKRQAVDDLKIPGGPDSSRGSSGDDAIAHPPPPGAPPSPGAGSLPPGWKRTVTAEGREYYYHEATGETSWTMPAA